MKSLSIFFQLSLSETVVFSAEKIITCLSKKRHEKKLLFFFCVCVSLSLVASHVWSEDESAEKEDGGEGCVGFDRE